MKTSLYGRELELGWLHRRIFRATERQGLPDINLIYGRPGIGKTVLLDAFVASSLQRQRSPTIFFRPDVSAGVAGVEIFAESMLRSAVACPEPWGVVAHTLGGQFSHNIQMQRRSKMPAAAAYSSKGTVSAIQASESLLIGDPRGQRLSELWLESLTVFVERESLKSGHLPRDLCLVICLDQFSDYAPSVKRWIGAVLMQAFLRSRKLAVPRILLTGRESYDSDGQRDYWEVPLGRIEEMELKAINRSSCIKWLTDEKIKPDVIDELMERTKGVPRNICELIADKKTVQAMEAEIERAEKSPSPSVQQRRWLHAAAILEYVDKEGLAVVLGGRDAEQAFEWLKQRVSDEGILLVDKSGPPQVFLTSGLRRKILAECEIRYTERHQDFQAKISIQKRLLEKVPSSIHRDFLRRLVSIEPFDLEMIDKIYGGHE